MKNPFKSKTIWGLIMVALPLLAQWLGVEFTDQESQQAYSAFVQLFGLGFAVYGRAKAKGPLTLNPPSGKTLKLLAFAVCILWTMPGCVSMAYRPDRVETITDNFRRSLGNEVRLGESGSVKFDFGTPYGTYIADISGMRTEIKSGVLYVYIESARITSTVEAFSIGALTVGGSVDITILKRWYRIDDYKLTDADVEAFGTAPEDKDNSGEADDIPPGIENYPTNQF